MGGLLTNQLVQNLDRKLDFRKKYQCFKKLNISYYWKVSLLYSSFGNKNGCEHR